MQQFTLEQFRATVESGGVVNVTLKAQGAAFVLQAETRRGGDAILVDRRKKQPRMFADPKKAMLLLRDMGIRNAKLDTQSWYPEQADMLRKPRSVATPIKTDHEAVVHDKTIQAQQAQVEVDDPNSQRVSNEDAKQEGIAA